jgi:hypothetical protein
MVSGAIITASVRGNAQAATVEGTTTAAKVRGKIQV